MSMFYIFKMMRHRNFWRTLLENMEKGKKKKIVLAAKGALLYEATVYYH